MAEKGIFITERVAVTMDTKTGKKTSETRDEKKGILFQERVARTYDKNSGKRSHESKNEERGVFFRKRFTKTTNLETGNESETRVVKKGIFWPKWTTKSDKKK